MEELDISLIKKRSIQGVFALVSRTFFIQVISFGVNFLLTIFLSPAIFGVYFIVTAVISFLTYFSDIGLAAALIQKKDALTQEDLKTTFTLQQVLVVSISLVALFSSGWIGKFYNLNLEGVWLFRALVIAFFLSSLKTIPSVIMERNLRFQKFVIPQVVETLFFNATVLFFAIKGFGITSFTYAVLARGISGVITIYIVSPWRIKFGFSKSAARKLLSFGIPFQTNSLLALLKDDLLTVYLGKILPLAQVGYIGFAQKWALTPLRLIMDNIIRITFPSFSRLQHEKKVLSQALEKSLFASTFFIFPSILGLVILFSYLIALIPKYNKWEPALFSLSFFAINAALSSISTPLTNALNAIGKIKITLFLMIFWVIATWILTPFAIFLFGFNGVSMASAFLSISVIIVVFLVRKFVEFDIFKSVGYPFLASIVMAVFLYFLSPIIVKNIAMLIIMIIAGALIYFMTIFLLAKNQLLADIRLIRENLRR
ncbi:MAG: oligosaccharide flippase family protein [Candidatus Levyibacteriota bacterium]